MPIKFTFANPLLKTWLLIHQTHNLMTRSENAIFAKLGLSTRKHSILMAIKSLPSPVTVTAVARLLDRNANGISMMVDRLIKDGLVSRVRDIPDRRAVRLALTHKGSERVDEANRLTWQLFQDIFAEINEADLRRTSTVLQKVRGKALDIVRPGHVKETLEVIPDTRLGLGSGYSSKK